MGRRAGLIPDQRGGTAVEYGLIGGLIAVAVITSIGLFGNGVDGMWDRMQSALVAELGGSSDSEGETSEGEGGAETSG